MKRGILAGITGAILLSGAFFAWNAVRQEREFRRLIAAGDAAITRDQTYEAIEAFSGALALKNDSMLAYLKRGDSYRRRGELSSALRDLREASSVDPTATRPLELLGDVNLAMGRYERATEVYRRYLALDDRAPHVLYKLALALYRSGQAEAALDPLRRAVALDGRFAEAHYLLAMCLEDQKHDDEAVRSFTRALEINPALGAAREELAVLQLAHGRTREGIEQLEALAALEPSQPQRLVNVGLAYARAGRTDAAITALGRAAERYPEADNVYIALGQVWLETGEAHNDRVALRKSLEALQPVASRPDATSDTLTLYGRALFLSGTVDEAERTLELAASRFPANPNAFLYLSAAAERRGHVTAAREALAKHLGLVGEHPADAPLLALRADVQVRLGQVAAARASIAEGLAIDQRNAALLQLRRKIG
ncbi:MAG TPA: tetratricopeptide repeat protein [Vicinamibacterales bacterium]|nr:tetratricopeptide repeat protein [Vicinamibacterales bacterium]